jgi:hypothetical protein
MKEDIQMINEHMKRGTILHVIRKYKLKQQWNTTAHLTKCPKSRALKIPKVGKDVGQKELSLVAGGNTKWHSYNGR